MHGHPQPSAPDEKVRSDRESLSTRSTSMLLGILGFFAAGITLVGWFVFKEAGQSDLFALPLLFIGGIFLLFVALAIVVVVFKRLDLQDSGKALGLPEGTVRAFIALSLILLFFMMAVFLFIRISENQRPLLEGLTAAERDGIPADQISFALEREDGTFDVYLVANNQAGEDIAKQLLTTVSTLVVAIAAFYFGANSVQTAYRTGESHGGETVVGATTAAALGANAAASAAAGAEAEDIRGGSAAAAGAKAAATGADAAAEAADQAATAGGSQDDLAEPEVEKAPPGSTENGEVPPAPGG